MLLLSLLFCDLSDLAALNTSSSHWVQLNTLSIYLPIYQQSEVDVEGRKCA